MYTCFRYYNYFFYGRCNAQTFNHLLFNGFAFSFFEVEATTVEGRSFTTLRLDLD